MHFKCTPLNFKTKVYVHECLPSSEEWNINETTQMSQSVSQWYFYQIIYSDELYET